MEYAYIYIFIQIIILKIIWFLSSKTCNPVHRAIIRFSAIGFVLAPTIIIHHGASPSMAFWILSICIYEFGRCGDMEWYAAIIPSFFSMVLLGLIAFFKFSLKDKKT